MSVVYIINRSSKMALDIDPNDGISVIQTPYHADDPSAGGDGQLWNLVGNGSGSFFLRAHRNPGYAIVKGTGGDFLIVDDTMAPKVWVPSLVNDPQYFFLLGAPGDIVGNDKQGTWMSVDQKSTASGAHIRVFFYDNGEQYQQWTFYPSFDNL